MTNELPKVLVKEKESSRKPLIYFLIFLCLIFTVFLIYVNFPPDLLSKKKSSSLSEIGISESCRELTELIINAKLIINLKKESGKRIDGIWSTLVLKADINKDGKVVNKKVALIL